MIDRCTMEQKGIEKAASDGQKKTCNRGEQRQRMDWRRKNSQ